MCFQPPWTWGVAGPGETRLTVVEVWEIKSWNGAGLFTQNRGRAGLASDRAGPCKASDGWSRVQVTVQAVCAGLWTGLGSPGACSLGETQPGTDPSSLVGPEEGLRESREK